MKIVSTPFVLGLLAAAALAVPSFADPVGIGGSEQVRRTVHLADVDLQTIVGARVAAERIRDAAGYVCGGDSRPILVVSDFTDCRNHAIDRALASLHAPLVSAALGRSTRTDFAAR